MNKDKLSYTTWNKMYKINPPLMESIMSTKITFFLCVCFYELSPVWGFRSIRYNLTVSW